MNNIAQKQHYTFKDYMSWDDDIRCELIDGQIYNMASPSNNHQRVIGRLLYQLDTFLKGRRCEVLSDIDVRLNADEYDDIVVRPDIIVVCDKNKLRQGHGCKGAPDLVVEVISPSSKVHDEVTKLQLYQNAGVREYWLADYKSKSVRVNVLENGKYDATTYTEDGNIHVGVLEGCVINLKDVFERVE